MSIPNGSINLLKEIGNQLHAAELQISRGQVKRARKEITDTIAALELVLKDKSHRSIPKRSRKRM